MKYRIIHRTGYTYSDPVTLCHNILHLKPRKTPRQQCLRAEIVIAPEPAIFDEHLDYYGNSVVYFCIEDRHDLLEIESVSELDVFPFTPPLVEFTPAWEDVREALIKHPAVHLDAADFIQESKHVKFDPALLDYAMKSFTPRRPVLAAALDLTARIYTEFAYDQTATSINTAPADVLKMRKGVCQDFAHLQIACFRAVGLPARYVSGYLQTRAAGDPRALVGADASHAWASFYCPEFGWIDLDPTNNLVPSDKHIVVSWGRDYADVSPVKGVILGGGKHVIAVGVSVQAV